MIHSGHDAGNEGGGQPLLQLLGSHRHALDDKRRVAIPKAFREQLAAAGLGGGSFVICRQLGGDGCLALYPQGRFEAQLADLEGLKQASMGVGSKKLRAYLRKVRMSAATLVPDKQGRIGLSEDQCRLAGISKDVVFVGNGDHMELWSPSRLDDDEFEDLTAELFG